ncbi:hypothetical protein JRQ81_017584, partial [Phrynocephalus forsythii]
DAFCQFMDSGPDNEGNLTAIWTAFISQSAPDIKKKLQKLPTPSALIIEVLLQTMFQVLYQRPEAEEDKSEQMMKKQATLLVAAIQSLIQQPQPVWHSTSGPQQSYVL